MCGRARCTLRTDDVPRACHRHGVPVRFLDTDRYRPSHNVAPGASLPVLRRDNGGDSNGNGVAVQCMKWGLVPSFTKKTEKPDFFKMFNARSESVSEKASFRRLLPKNRCLVTVEGFYEWKKDGSKRQPYYIHLKDGRPLVFAALYDSWQSSEGEKLCTFTILTTSSSSALQWLHDRMPVILGDKESVDMWLDDSSTTKLKTILKPYESSDLVWYAVTPAIGKTSFDGPECIQEIPLKTPEKNLISKFFSTKQPKREETNRESQSVSETFEKDLKEEPIAEDCKGVVFTDNIKKNEELGEEKGSVVLDEATKTDFHKVVKVEPLMEGGLTVTSAIKHEVGEDRTSIQDESVKTDLPKTVKEEEEYGKWKTNKPKEPQMGDNMGPTFSLELLKVESTATSQPQTLKEHLALAHPHIENQEPHRSKLPLETVKEEPRSEDQTVMTCSGKLHKGELKSCDIESCKQISEQSGTKRDYEVFLAQQKPSKQSDNMRNVKSSEKHGKKQGHKKCDLKSPGEKQSTLHWFFGKK